MFSCFLHPPSLKLLLPLLLLIHVVSSSPTKISPTKIGKGYRLVSIQEAPNGGLLGLLQVKQKTNIYGSDIPSLQFYAKHETQDRLRVHITDADKQRWEIPYNLLPREEPPVLKKSLGKSKKVGYGESEISGNELIFSYISDPFSFAVKRKSNGQTLFNSTTDESDPYNSLVFKDQYIEISTKLPKDASLYGLGENTQPGGIKLKPNDPYTLYTTDISAINLNSDLYGSHPVYMDLRNVGGEAFAHAVLLLNSNGMDVVYRGDSLTYKVIGGVLDLSFFAGSTPLAVVDQYTQFVGRPAPMPYWALERDPSWRPIMNPLKMDSTTGEPDAFVNGEPFWADRTRIISFDPTNEEFRVIGLPDELSEETFWYPIFEFEGSLSFVEQHRDDKPIFSLWILNDNVWVSMKKNIAMPFEGTNLNEYFSGRGESWTADGYNFSSRGGELLGTVIADEDDKYVFLYNFLNNQFKRIQITGQGLRFSDITKQNYMERWVRMRNYVENAG